MPAESVLVAKAGGFAIISSANSYDKLALMAKSISAGDAGIHATTVLQAFILKQNVFTEESTKLSEKSKARKNQHFF